MISYPTAKINLGLNILRKREDGYHDIESVFYPIPWQDMLEIVPEKASSGKVTFSSTGIEIPSNGKPNLCEQVYYLLNEEKELPSVKIHLHKIVPIGAGLGGGSADAAFVATMLNDMFELGLSESKLEEVVSKAGSDCPFFIKNKPAYVTGRGENLEHCGLNLQGYWIKLINPNIHVGTAEAYSGIKPAVPEVSLKVLLNKDVAEWRGLVKNDFEDSVFEKHPAIERLKNQLYEQGAEYSSMTGSGSTVFGLFQNKPEELPSEKEFSIKIVQL